MSSLRDLAHAWVDFAAVPREIVRTIAYRDRADGERAAMALRTSANLYDAFRAARGYRPGDRVDVIGGVPCTYGRPVGYVERVNARSITVRLACDGSTHYVSPAQLRLDWSDALAAARAELVGST